MNDILTTVIIPVYKVEKYLEKCVRSVMDQRERHLEIILVDDGSPDRCGEICDRLAREDERIRVIHQTNQGLSAARNSGIEIAAGDCLCFLDSDDYWGPEFLQEMLSVRRETGAQLVVCPLRYENEDGTVLNNTQKTPAGVFDSEQMLTFLCTPGSPQYVTAHNRLYEKSLWEKLRFPVGRIHEDEYVAHEIYAACRKIAVTDRTVYHYLQREGSITTLESPKKQMDGIEAFALRCRFLKERGDEVLFQQSFKMFLHYYLTLLGSDQTGTEEDKVRFREIHGMARDLLHQGADANMKEKLAVYRPGLWQKLHRIHGGKE